MPTLERSVHTPAPVPTVREYLRDFANAEEWDAGTRSCTPVDDTAIGVGKQWRNVSEFRGRETELIYTLDADESDHVRLVGKNKTVTSEDDLFLVAGPTGTTVTYRARFTFHGAAKLVTPLLRPALGTLADDAERTLRAALERLPVA